MQAEKAQVASGPARRMRGVQVGAFGNAEGPCREPFASLRIKLFITKSNFIVNWFKVILQLCACISYFGKNGYFP